MVISPQVNLPQILVISPQLLGHLAPSVGHLAPKKKTIHYDLKCSFKLFVTYILSFPLKRGRKNLEITDCKIDFIGDVHRDGRHYN